MVLQPLLSPKESNGDGGRKPKTDSKSQPARPYPCISYSNGLVHHVMLKFKEYNFVFMLALVVSCFASVIRFLMQMFRSWLLDHDDTNPLSRLDTVFAFHTSQWAGSPVVEVVIE